MRAKELQQKLQSKTPPAVVDVRSGFEFRSGHIPGAVHAPTWKILFRMVNLPKDKTSQLVLTCEHGPRARMAQGLLGRLGYRNTLLLEGHMAGWRHAGFKTEK